MKRLGKAVTAWRLLILMVILPGTADAQGVQWTRQFGASGFDVARAIGVEGTSVYVLGAASAGLPGQTYAGGPDDVFLRKYDQSGNEIWTRQFGTPGNDFPAAGHVGIDETGVYVAGFTEGTLPGESNAGGEDGFIRKYDFDGNVLWTDQFGSACHDEPNGLAVARESVFVVWDTGSGPTPPPPGCEDSFLRRYDTAGNVLWTRQFGGPDAEFFVGVDADKTGVYVSGLIVKDLGGDWDALVGKYDFDGDLAWMHQFGTEGRDESEAVAVKKGSVYVAGFTFGTLGESSAGAEDIFLRKYDTDGTEIWTRQFGTPGNDGASFRGVATDGRGVYISGPREMIERSPSRSETMRTST